MNDKLLEAVGRRRVLIVDEETQETLARGVLMSASYELDGDRANISEALVALDLPGHIRSPPWQ